MKNRILLSAVVLALVRAAFAVSTVSDVIVRQRWPWSETVDIDYTLTGGKGDVTFTATWDGQTAPVMLGTDFQVEAGQHRFEWCPTNSYAGRTLTGFTVTADVGSAVDHKYLIIDLVDGGYSFTNAPPEGGWTSEHKSTKMVFARCPAGTYTTGLPGTVDDSTQTSTGDMTYVASGDLGFSYLYVKNSRTRTVTFTSDWYVGIYPMTGAQYAKITSGAPSSDYTAYQIAYNALRGATNDTPSVDWPGTKYLVSGGSVVDKLRKLTGNVLCIDLPQEEQFEIAVRAGTTTLWPNGGTTSDSHAALTNTVNQILNWYASTGNTDRQEVGLMAGNGWGLYDFAANKSASWNLDKAPCTGSRNYPSITPSGGTNPVGFREMCDKRVVHCSGQSVDGTALYQYLPSMRYAFAPSYSAVAARFAIHLKPLDF